MQASYNGFHKRTSAIIVCIVLFFSFLSFLVGGVGSAYAATTEYSDVLSDLTADRKFNPAEYPTNADDHKINLIQIAEGKAGNLFVYTYQPCQKTTPLMATFLNMSLSENAEGTKLYSLSLLNSNGVFCKYAVDNFTVSGEATRLYNITSIYRDWIKDIDEETGNDNTTESVAYKIGRLYRVKTESGKATYKCDPVYTVKIINPYSDFMLYITAASVPPIPSIKLSFDTLGMIDAHYIAFSTDWDIDRLNSATVTYTYCPCESDYETIFGFGDGEGNVTYGEEQIGYAYPTYEDKYEYETPNSYLIHYKYKWDRIQRVSDFLATEKDLREETKNNLADKQWVLRFLETERTQTTTGVLGFKKYHSTFTKVSNVAILRLNFDVDGKTYDLGTISDIVSGDNLPGNGDITQAQTFWEWLTSVTGIPLWGWILIGVAVLLVILLPVLSAICPAVGQVLLWIVKGVGFFVKYLFLGLWYIISAPFRLIAWLIGRKKNDGEGTEENQEKEVKTNGKEKR